MQEVVALHDHVVEFKEAESLLHALLVALGAEHIVDREARAHIAEQFNVIELQQPVGVVDKLCLALAKVDEFAHLLLEAFDVMLNGFGRHHLPEIGSAGRIADHRGAAADKGNRLVARHLKTLHQAERHEVSHVERIRRRVKPDVERRLAVVDKFLDFLFISHLSNQSSGDQFLVDLHCFSLLNSIVQ